MIQRLPDAEIASILPPDAAAKVLKVCAELFPGEVSFEIGSDPSWPGESWPVVVVEATGTADHKVQQSMQWHQRIVEELGPDHHLRLQIVHR